MNKTKEKIFQKYFDMERSSFAFYKVINLPFEFKKDVKIFNLFDRELFSIFMSKEIEIDHIPDEKDIKSKCNLRSIIEKMPNRGYCHFDYKEDIRRYNDFSIITQDELSFLLKLESDYST